MNMISLCQSQSLLFKEFVLTNKNLCLLVVINIKTVAYMLKILAIKHDFHACHFLKSGETFLFVCFWASPGRDLGFLLSLCSEVTSSSVRGPYGMSRLHANPSLLC